MVRLEKKIVNLNLKQLLIFFYSFLSKVECKCVFGEESYTSDSAVELSVHLRSNAPLPIHCGRVQILLDDKV